MIKKEAMSIDCVEMISIYILILINKKGVIINEKDKDINAFSCDWIDY